MTAPRHERFKRTAEPRHTSEGMIEEYELELRPGHVVTRVDSTSRLGAGRKGRAAEVSLHRTLTCTCGGHLSFGGLSVAEDLAHLRHYESAEQREAEERKDAETRAAILRSLGVSE